ncbi:MAG: hypothetical protein C0598_11320 [Marinilabiliales bacterium]|nr:MAG: hypothetical protein C0598_11320 [Marinilabiliales bacterium]
MEEKIQSNQNPEQSTDENSKTEKVEMTKKNEVQLSAKEREEISTLLKTKTQSNKPKAADSQDKQAEPQENPKTEEEKVDAAPKKAETVNQLSEEERNEIRQLLSGKISKTSYDEHEIDYDHLNKQELVELLEDVVLDKDISHIKKQVAEIKTHFIKLNKEEIASELQDFLAEGGDEEEFKHNEDPLEKRFNIAFGVYRHNKAKYSEQLEKQKIVNLQKKHDILEELKELINSEETLKKTYDEFKAIQERWKEIGMVPAAELSELWKNYHFLVEKFFDKVRINNELRDLDLKKNMEAKIALCEKAEELLVEDSVVKSFKLLQKYHDEYREIGPAPSDKKDELWERFKAATDKINEKRREYYAGIQNIQEDNYKAKLALIEQVQEVVSQEFESIKDWNSNTDKVNNLLKTWKTIGRVPKAHNDEVWETFRGHLNNFFERKRKFFGEVKDQQMNNYNLKLNLCVEAENLQDSTDWKQTTNKLIKLQKEWKAIGPVPRRHSDKIWKRFRAACDVFFNNKSSHFKGRKEEEKNNLKAKEDLIEKIKAFNPTEDKKNNLDTLKEFQRSWVEIGFVPFDKKDKVQSEYREAVDSLLDKMQIKKSELSQEDFKEKVEIMKNSPDSDRVISKERAFLSNKIKKLQEDVTLWENNIGFFTVSSKSSTFKDDFQKKIDKAKKEIEQIKEKIRML